MKAPDKIYVREFPEGLNQMWSSIKATETRANAQHEYIRKEALMEWINTAKNSLLMDTKAPHLGKVGSLATLDALTDILNEM